MPDPRPATPHLGAGTAVRRSPVPGWALPAAVLLALVLLPTVGGERATAQEQPVDLGAYGVPLRFEAPDGVVLEVADSGRYVDTLEAVIARDGDLVLVNELDLDEYVAGIHEMPARWPMEALKAQAVAARTYAWYQATLGTFQPRGYDICRTTACQVFSGREVVETPEVGQRWQRAVDATAGEVLLYQGEPILARYFSTSGGRTRNNEDVFPSEGAYPYLEAVDDPQDAVSPLHDWRVRFPREHLEAIFQRGQTLREAVPIGELELVAGDGAGTDRVRAVRGTDGHAVEVGASEFRAFVSRVARDLFPDRYPTDRGDGRSLPTTLPSSRFSFTVDADAIVVDGRGWGHGVGMSQWGARGRAEQGATYDEILASYYQGVRLARPERAPDRLRVGLLSSEPPGGEVEIRADGPFRVVAGDTEVTDRGLGAWTVSLRGDRSLGLRAPAGFGAPLVVSPTEVNRSEVVEVERLRIETVVNKPAELALVVTTPDGEEVHREPLGVVEAGRREASWGLDGPTGPVSPGRYEVGLEAVDEERTRAREPTPVTVSALGRPPQPPQTLLDAVPARSGGDGGATSLLLVVLLGLGGGALAGAVLRLPTPSRGSV